MKNIIEATNMLTSTERRLADYILSHKEEVIKMSIHTLAEKSQMSASTISKFIKKIGFASFQTFKITLAQSMQNDILDDKIEQFDSTKDILTKLDFSVHESLNRTKDLIDIHNIEKAIHALTNAERIFLSGIGASGLVCSDFYYKLSRIGKNVVYHTDSHIQLANITTISSNDVILAISYSSKTKEVRQALAYAHDKGATNISITGVGNDTLQLYSTYSFKIPRHERDIRSAAITSRNDSLFLTDLLYLGIIQDNPMDIETLLFETRRLTDQLRQ